MRQQLCFIFLSLLIPFFAKAADSNCNLLKELAKKPVWQFRGSFDDKSDLIIADKSRRLLHLIKDDQVIRTYRMALGKEPVGDKKCEGDNKTPEGFYTISYKNSGSDFHRSLAVDYPRQQDINEARKLGCDAGSDIMIHGLPNSRFKRAFINHPSDWTRGCMAVTNAEIQEIWRLVDTKTPIEICK